MSVKVLRTITQILTRKGTKFEYILYYKYGTKYLMNKFEDIEDLSNKTICKFGFWCKYYMLTCFMLLNIILNLIIGLNLNFYIGLNILCQSKFKKAI